jgi:aerobic carbon-monoxide dehydrogenase small subunit
MTSTRTKRLCTRLNGRSVEVELDPRALLIEAVRELGAKGARVGCLTGDCGACSLELDGRLVKSCLVLAVSAEDSDIATIEGGRDEITRELQDAFVACNGFQCGFCTSGMIMVAVDLLRSNPSPTEAEIRRAISGNLCRCTGYENIVSAVVRAADALRHKSTQKALNGE